MKKEPVRRIIYSNYDLWEKYEEFAREELAESGNKNPSNSEIWDIISEQDAIAWQDEKERLIDFFSGEKWILRGTVGRWNGSFEAGTVFDDFVEMFYKITRSCDYFSLYDENGHMYLECSHHDGTNKYEIKKITDRGIDYLGNWEEKWNDKRTERQVHDTIMKRYSVLPHYAHTMYESPKTEWKRGE